MNQPCVLRLSKETVGILRTGFVKPVLSPSNRLW